MSLTLEDRFHGCIAGSFIGSAMGAATEGATWQETHARLGHVTELLPYEHYGNGWTREAGTTEEGVERQKRLAAAIIHHGRRVTAEEVVALWLETVDLEAAALVSEPFELRALAMARVGVPARDLGGYSDLTGHIAFAAATQPIGLINAGDPQAARADVSEIGQIYQAAGSRGLLWAVAPGVAVAEATRPGATLDSILATVLELSDPQWVAKELDKHLGLTAGIDAVEELRAYFDGVYGGTGILYPFAHANEVVTKAFCLLRLTGGDVAATIEAAVNFGRDTSSLAAIAAGIGGALHGASALPPAWERQVDAATAANPHTCSRASIREFSTAFAGVFRAKIDAQRTWVRDMANA